MKFVNLNTIKSFDALQIKTTANALMGFAGSEKYVVTVELSNRLKRAAGNIRVKLKKNVKINISADYYKQFGIERTLKTLKHEFAHLISFHHTGKVDHSPYFKKICAELGGSMNPKMAGSTHSASACNEYIRGNLKNYKWIYTCKCGVVMEYSRRMADKTRRNPHVVCRKCRTSVSMWSEEKVYN